MRRFAVIACVCALGAGATNASARLRLPGSASPGAVIDQAGAGRLERLEQWLKAAARHATGEDDQTLQDVAAWLTIQLKQLWIDANVLTQLIHGATTDRFTVPQEGGTSSTLIRVTKAQLHRFHVLACAAGGVLSTRRAR